MLMKKFKVSEDVLAMIINYIQSKPFTEVNKLMTILQSDIELVGEEEVERPIPEKVVEDKKEAEDFVEKPKKKKK